MSKTKNVLNLTLVALLGTLVLMAPGAQAKNQLVVEGEVVKEGEVVELKATGGNYRSGIPELGIVLECPTATLTLNIKNQSTGAVGSGTALAEECSIAEFEEVCESHTAGQGAGSIQIPAESINIRSLGTDLYLVATVKSPNIEHGGEECPFLELSLQVTGTGGFKFVSPFTEAVSHTVKDITAEEESALEVAAFLGEDPLFVEEGEATAHLAGKFEGMKFSLN